MFVHNLCYLTNSGSGGGECELKEPANKLVTRSEISQEEASITNESLLRGIRSSVCKCVAYRPLTRNMA
jgi:hypothetical protein